MEPDLKIRSFTDLNCWKEGHKLVLMIYLATKNFPNAEKYDLISQIRRAAVSITSNIAEGFNRHSPKEKCQFYYMSLGSLAEVQNQILIARDLGYVSSKAFKEIANESIIVSRLLNGLIKSIKTHTT
jgi:four helix bundle protein